jgi:alpha-1,2-mannosyltransferase
LIHPQPADRAWQWLVNHPFTVAASLYLAFNCVPFMGRRDFTEWDHVFVLAARHLRAGLDFYQLTPEGQDHPYSYPPFWAMLAVPFTFLPRFVARFVWYLINVLAVVLLWRWSWRASGGSKLEANASQPTLSRKSQYLICILGLACGMRFVQDNLDHQQVDLVIGAIVVGGCIAWQRGQDWLAATAWGLAAAMKGPPLLFAIYLLWRGRWSAAMWMITLAIGVNLLPDLVHRAPQGLWLSQWYVEMIKPMGEIGVWHSDPQFNQSIAGAARRIPGVFFSPAALKRLVYGIEAALVAVTAFFIRPPLRLKIDPFRAAIECSMVILLMLLLSPMSSKPHFCVLLLPGFCLARLAVEKRNRAAMISIITCLILSDVLDRNLMGSRSIGDAALAYGSVMWAAIALWVGCLATLRKQLPIANPAAPATFLTS